MSRAAELRPRATALSTPKSVLPCRRVCEVPKFINQVIYPIREISLKFREPVNPAEDSKVGCCRHEAVVKHLAHGSVPAAGCRAWGGMCMPVVSRQSWGRGGKEREIRGYCVLNLPVKQVTGLFP